MGQGPAGRNRETSVKPHGGWSAAADVLLLDSNEFIGNFDETLVNFGSGGQVLTANGVQSTPRSLTTGEMVCDSEAGI